VDSGYYPERNGDGIARRIDGGVAAGTVYKRDTDYMAPVTAHFGNSHLPEGILKPSDLIGGSTFERWEKIAYIDELDPEDNVTLRLKDSRQYFSREHIRPEAEWAGDGIVLQTMMLPFDEETAKAAALEIVRKQGLQDAEVVHTLVMQPAEGTLVEIRGRVAFDLDAASLEIMRKPELLSEEEIRKEISERPMRIIAGTLGEDEHSVGLREIIDIKHGGIEKYGIECIYLGTSVPVEKMIDASVEADADAVLASVIISHDGIHYRNLKKLCDTAIEKGVREKLIIIGGGTQISDKQAMLTGIDAGFGRGTKGIQVADFLVRNRREKQ
jgi:D-ornithine 4,5-aminomutase subunit beta